jgi:hypothetical protein
VTCRKHLKRTAAIVTCCVSFQVWASPELPTQPLSHDAAALFDWLVRARDNQDLPFMIIDKRRAHLWVFDRAAQLQGNAPVLLGMALGDHTAPGVGDKELSQIKFDDRTTPAGRFLAEVGLNVRGEDVVWIDYDSGVSMHRVITTNPKERRAERLETPTPDDNRVSFGCINVSKGFYEATVSTTVKGGKSVVYILPDSHPVHSVFSHLGAAAATISTY